MKIEEMNKELVKGMLEERTGHDSIGPQYHKLRNGE